jgi:large subunit ribosomal protein L21
MFAIVRTGGKQYRVAPGDKIVVEKLAGDAGDTIDLTDILLAGEGSDLKSTAGLTVGAKIVAQAKGDKVTVFKKRRRHNYRRKAGHRQQHTILEIVSIGGQKADKKPAAKAEAAKPETKAAPAAKAETKAAAAPKAETKAEKPKTDKPKTGDKPAAKPAAAAKASTKDAAPAKAAAKKAPAAKAKK